MAGTQSDSKRVHNCIVQGDNTLPDLIEMVEKNWRAFGGALATPRVITFEEASKTDYADREKFIPLDEIDEELQVSKYETVSGSKLAFCCTNNVRAPVGFKSIQVPLLARSLIIGRAGAAKTMLLAEGNSLIEAELKVPQLAAFITELSDYIVMRTGGTGAKFDSGILLGAVILMIEYGRPYISKFVWSMAGHSFIYREEDWSGCYGKVFDVLVPTLDCHSIDSIRMTNIWHQTRDITVDDAAGGARMSYTFRFLSNHLIFGKVRFAIRNPEIVTAAFHVGGMTVIYSSPIDEGIVGLFFQSVRTSFIRGPVDTEGSAGVYQVSMPSTAYDRIVSMSARTTLMASLDCAKQSMADVAKRWCKEIIRARFIPVICGSEGAGKDIYHLPRMVVENSGVKYMCMDGFESLHVTRQFYQQYLQSDPSITSGLV